MDIDLKKIRHAHFIGIGGIGISAIARMMLHDNKKVTGQDMRDSDIISELRGAGADIVIGQSFGAIPQDADLIIYTIAIENYDSELLEKLKGQNIPIRSYPQMLFLISKDKYTIAISGTHGKTTTTGMVAGILRDAKYDPTVIIGSLLIEEKSNFLAGAGKYFIVEACEYKRSFLNINPQILIITNIDADHLDYYKDIDDIARAFRELAEKVPSDGYVICNIRDMRTADVVAGIKAKVIDYNNFFDEKIKLKIPGLHNRKNAAAARATASVLGVDDIVIQKSLAEFSGTWRRFEYKGLLSGGAKLYDDYAHHPAEISATLEGFRELYPQKDGWKIIVVFQPHLFSRTKLLLNEFAQSFGLADKIFLLPIYPAREKDDGTISSHILEKEICNNGREVLAFDNFTEAENYIEKIVLGPKDILVTMGAGEAYRIGEKKHPLLLPTC